METQQGRHAVAIARTRAADDERKEAIAGVKLEFCRANGLALTLPDGTEVADIDGAKQRASDSILARDIAHELEERAVHGVSHGQLFDLTFTKQPIDKETADEWEQAAIGQLTRSLWDVTRLSAGSMTQSRTPEGTLLCKADVYRGHDLVTVAFITDNPVLMFESHVQPELDEAMRKVARRISNSGLLVGTTRPEFAAQVQKRIGQGMRKASEAAMPALPAAVEAATDAA